MEMIRYPVPQPVPPLAVRRLVPDNAAQIAALYRAGGRDGAWCAEENTVRALFDLNAVWWGGFAGSDLVLCAACAASTADTPQAAALRGALASWIENPMPEPECFLLPPAVSRQGEMLADPLLSLLTEQLFSFAADALRPQEAEFLSQDVRRESTRLSGELQLQKSGCFLQDAPEAPAYLSGVHWPRGDKAAPAALLAALPVKAPAPLLAAYFAAGFAAVRTRPLVSLRPHYLFQWRGAPEQTAENDVLSLQEETGAVRRVYLPLADTLAVSRLLEQGFCATALCRNSADERTLIRLER